MYVWGGGWNEEDTAAGIDAMTIGKSPRWKDFFDSQNKNYDYKNHLYKIREGLDCSGFVGWSLYNTFPNDKGYVMKSTIMAKTFSENGFGEFTPKNKVTDFKAGDILSTNGHVWISLGQCSDGSVVILHASPPGVMINGTKEKENTEAVELSKYYMNTYFPEWTEKFPVYEKNNSYKTNYDRFRWSDNVLPDPDNYRNMAADEVLADLFDN